MDSMQKRAQPILGTFVEITVPEENADAMDAAFETIRDIHTLMSFHEADSDVSKINGANPGERIKCDLMTVEVIALSKSLYEQSNGYFDICTGANLSKNGFLPKMTGYALKTFSGSPADIIVEDENHIRLKQRCMIDLGGIAKGYAVDCAVTTLKARGAPAGMVNAGGDLRCYGDMNWPVVLREADGVLGAEISIASCAIASSANRITRKRKLGRRVTPHVGKTGASVLIDETITIVAQQCVIADAFTKIAMSDVDLANNLLAKLNGYVLDNNAPSILPN